MRFTTFVQTAMTDSAPHTLAFAGGRGEYLAITALEPDIIRICHWPEGRPRLNRTWLVVGADGDVPREGRRRDDLSPFSLPGWQPVEAPPGVIRRRTDNLQLEIAPDSFALRWFDAGGRAFAADLSGRAYAYDRAGRAVMHYLERRPDEHYYGCGESAGPLDKHGRRLRLAAVDALGYDAARTDPLYKHWPFYITYVPEQQIAYGLFYDNLAEGVFDLGQEINGIWGRYRYYRAEDGDLDYYLIFGPTIAEVVEKFARLTGRPALPPRWTLGYLGSTMLYTEMPDAQAQLDGFIEKCRAHDIPCDLFHLSSGYTTDAEGRRNVFTWNRDKIPDPQAMVDGFHRAGIRLSANIKPYLLATHPRYDEAAALGAFVHDTERDAPLVHQSWSAGLNQSAGASYLDFTGAGFDWWKRQINETLLAYDIDGLWNDNNEFEIPDDEARFDGAGEPLRAGLGRPLQTLLMARASYEALREARPNERPYLISRSGCPGLQRYAQTWSGDNSTAWETLRFNIPMGLSLSLSGMPNTGHDVGGFFGAPPDRELFVRWIQCGLVHPRFTIHSVGLNTATEPWMYPDILPLVRDLFRFRRRLIPYLYTLLFRAAQTGTPVIRPTVYHFPDDSRTHTESFDLMLGPGLLAAPVLEAGARRRAVYLPGNDFWCDFYSGAWFAGGQTIEADAPLERLPLLAPAGAVIPLAGEADPTRREVYVFPHPGAGRGSFTLVEDDGVSLDYRRGQYTEVLLEALAEPERITLSARRTRSGYALPYAEVEFVLPLGEKRPAAGGAEIKRPDGRRGVVVSLRDADV